MHVRYRSTTLLRVMALAVFLACAGDPPLAPGVAAIKGIIVLDGFVQPGLTLLADTGTATTRIAFGPPTEFDASSFSLANDTVLASSSRGAGDLLYITALGTRVVQRIQLPARSNPSQPRLFTGGGGQALMAVPLRDSAAVLLVRANSSTATFSRLMNAGTCPSDVFQFESATWVVDANANCRVDYASFGNVRLIRIPEDGGRRDTIGLPGVSGSGATAIVSNGVAFVSAGGDADFSSFPYRVMSSGAIARVDLHTRSLLQVKAMPAGSYGASTARGRDGSLYVTVYENLDTFNSRILQLRADDLSALNTSASAPWRKLIAIDGSDVPCAGGVADASGRLHCLVSGAASVTSVVVFDQTGHEVRRVAAGQGGVDLALW